MRSGISVGLLGFEHALHRQRELPPALVSASSRRRPPPNELTLAEGFSPPKDAPDSLDILPISVGTDPGLTLATRKGTGYYKVPSLKGIWYRGHYLHDGSVTTLEEMFDPDRLKETHVPGGWRPVGSLTHPIKGHEFGLHLEPAEREALIAFLRTL